MCGIFGIYGQAGAAALTQLGLFSLQHRGQESAGIVSVDGTNAMALRRMGLVSEAISTDDLSAMTANIAVGHTRYSTAGSSTLDNAQPMFVHIRSGHVALAHNGNLTNSDIARENLEAHGSIFGSSMDSEVIVHLLAKARSAKPEEMLAEALGGLEGAYSIVLTIGRTLLAARDP